MANLQDIDLEKKSQSATSSDILNLRREKAVLAFAKYAEKMQLYDVTKDPNRSSAVFDKDKLRSYMKNPSKNVKNLRNLSRFLAYRSQSYKRIINYNASMIDLDMRSVIPVADFSKKKVDKNKMVKSYYQTLYALEYMNLKSEFLKAYITCFREDVFYGCAYFEPREKSFFILPLDPDYCRISGIYGDGSLAFDMDMSYFSRHKEQVEFWGEPFKSMFSAYQKDTRNAKWQPMPDENCVCLKVNLEDLEVPLPVFLGLFDALINLEDLKEIMAIADEQQIYKMLVAKIPLLSNTKEPNDFAVEPELVIDYFDKIKDLIPDYANVALSLTDIEPIEFNQDQTNDVNKVSRATENVMRTAGGTALAGGQGATSVNLTMKLDENFALSSLLPQTEAIVNRLLAHKIPNAAKVKFIKVTTYTKQEYRADLVKFAQYGVPIKLELGTLLGFNEIELIAKAHLEDALDVVGLFKPLQSTNTMDTGELEKKIDSEITDAGEQTRESRDLAG